MKKNVFPTLTALCAATALLSGCGGHTGSGNFGSGSYVEPRKPKEISYEVSGDIANAQYVDARELDVVLPEGKTTVKLSGDLIPNFAIVSVRGSNRDSWVSCKISYDGKVVVEEKGIGEQFIHCSGPSYT